MADNTKQDFQWLDIPDGQGGTERKWCKDAEARAAIEHLDPASAATDAICEDIVDDIVDGTHKTQGHDDDVIPVSGLKAALTKYGTDVVNEGLSGKQDTIADLSDIRSGASAGATAYQKPSTGIPSTDMTAAVQASLAKADTAIQDISGKSDVGHTHDDRYYTETEIDAKEQAITDLIPTQATSSNQLADKDFVNSSISTSTATFRGTSATGLSEAQFLAWANALTKDENDYVFWNTTDSDGNTLFKRYKYNGTAWVYEYTLNNSSFTADQWAALNSGITDVLTGKLSALPTNSELTTQLGNKVDKTTTVNGHALSGNVSVSKSDVGLGSVANTGDSATPVSGGTTKFTTGGAYTELAKKADKSATVSTVAYDATNGKLTKTINGTTTDIVVLDTAPTSGSKKPVTSGAVYQAIQEALINPISDSSIVSTTTFNKRDVISLNGTMYMADNATSDLPLKTPVVQGSNIVTQDGMVVIQGGAASSDWHSFG